MTQAAGRHNMEPAALLDAADHDAHRLPVIAGTNWKRPVPHCPAWDTAELVRHTGGILSWMSAVVESNQRVSCHASQFPMGGCHLSLARCPASGDQLALTRLGILRLPSLTLTQWKARRHSMGTFVLTCRLRTVGGKQEHKARLKSVCLVTRIGARGPAEPLIAA